MFGSESEHGTRPLVEVLPVHRALIELDEASNVPHACAATEHRGLTPDPTLEVAGRGVAGIRKLVTGARVSVGVQSDRLLSVLGSSLRRAEGTEM